MQSPSSHTPLPLAIPEPPPAHGLSRRSMLRNSGLGLGVGLAAVVGSATLGGCTLGDQESEPDAFIALAESARADAEAAGQLLVQLPDLAAALTTIATERTAHADALEAELIRVSGTTTPEAEPTAAAGEPDGGTPPPPPPTLDALRVALTSAQRAAADTARASIGYRAGLAGAISASCAAENEVLLP